MVKYAGGGYTPGDTWELFVGPDYRVKEMAYHRGGSVKPSLVIATWAGYKKAGPLLDRKSTRLNSSHLGISYAVFCLKKKKNKQSRIRSVHMTGQKRFSDAL